MKYIIGMGMLLLAAISFAEEDDSTATLIEIQGEVLVNQGTGYQQAQPDMRLKKGDRIMLMEEATAIIKYDNQCREKLEDHTVIHTVDSESCLAAAAGAGAAAAAAAGAGAAAAGTGVAAGAGAATIAGISTTTIGAVVGGGIVIGGIAAVNNGSDGPPLSP